MLDNLLITQQKLNKYCVDKQPINPEELLVQCSHCSEWLHAHCLEEQAIANAAAEHKIISPPPKKRGRPSKAAKANGDDPASKSGFAAELSTSDTSNLRLTVTDNRTFEKKRQWNVDVTCLMCDKVIEKAEDASQSSSAKTSTANTRGGAVNDETDANGTTAGAQEIEDAVSRESERDSVIGTQDPGEDAQTTSAQAEDATTSTSPATAEKQGETVEPSSTD